MRFSWCRLGAVGSQPRRADRALGEAAASAAWSVVSWTRPRRSRIVDARAGAQAFRANEHFAKDHACADATAQSRARKRAHVRIRRAGGSLIVTPADVENAMSSSSTMESVIIALTPEALGELAVQEFGSARVDLQPPPEP